jgi:multiple sugar transport system substrate-binding protein
MKRLLALVLGIMIVLSMPIAFAEEEVILTFSNWGDGTEQAMFESVFDLYKQQNPHVTVNYLFIPYGEYMTKLNTMAASGTMPDLGQMQTENTILWAENDMYADMGAMFESGQVAPRLSSLYFAPVNDQFSAACYISETNVLFFDRAYCESMGVTVPTRVEDSWTWEEFIDACIKLTVDVNGKHPNEEGFDPENIDVYGCSDMPASIMAWSNGGGFFSPDCTELWFDRPETIEAVQAVADLMNVHHVSPTPTSRNAIGGGNYPLMTGKIAMHVGGQFCLLWYSEFIESGEIDLGFGVLPKFKQDANTVWGNPVVVFEASKHKEEALKLAEFFYNTENLVECINQGLWMPSEESYYTDPALMAKWIDESPNRDDSFYGVVEMANLAYPSSGMMLGNDAELGNLYNPLLDQVWLGEKTADEVIRGEIMPLIQPVFEEYWASK